MIVTFFYDKEAKAKVEEKLGSFLPPEVKTMSDKEFEVFCAKFMANVSASQPNRPVSDDIIDLMGKVDVPFSIGKLR